MVTAPCVVFISTAEHNRNEGRSVFSTLPTMVTSTILDAGGKGMGITQILAAKKNALQVQG